MPACPPRHAWLTLGHAAPAALPVWAALKRLDPDTASLGERLAACIGGDDAAFADRCLDEGSTPRPARLPPRLLARLRSSEVARQVERALAREARHHHHHLLTPADPSYPERLSRIDDPPPMLALTGHPGALSLPGVAIVGARRASLAGLETARSLAAALAGTGLSVLSGLALGIDAAAHQGVLDADGVTVAVLATGPERIYPERHAALAERICARGALVTEFPAGSRLRPGHFPIRNRLGSALSEGVVLIEAAERSGTLGTATHARRQNREVMVVPGSPGDPRHAGGHDLLRDGATPVLDARDVVRAIAPGLRHELDALCRAPVASAQSPGWPGRQGPRAPGAPGDPDAACVLAALGGRETPSERLCAATGLPAPRVMAALGLLELHGLARRGSEGGYSLCIAVRTPPSGTPAHGDQTTPKGGRNIAGVDASPVFDLD